MINVGGAKAGIALSKGVLERAVQHGGPNVEEGTAWRLGAPGRNRFLREWVISGLESLSEAGAERAVVDGTANLEQKQGLRMKPRMFSSHVGCDQTKRNESRSLLL